MLTFKKLKIQNFLSFKESILILDKPALILIEGKNTSNACFDSNGCGKSSIVDSLLWCLWGQTLRGHKADEVVNQHLGKDCLVSLSFEDDFRNNWEIKRARKHCEFENRVILYKNGIEWNEDVKVQDKITSILGIDFKSFANTFVFYRGDSKTFSASADGEQKRILEKLFDLEIYSALTDKTKEKQTLCKVELAQIDSQLQICNTKIEGYSQNITAILTKIQFHKEATLKTIEASKKEIEALEASILNQDSPTIVSILTKIQSYKDVTLKAIEASKKEIEALEASITNQDIDLNEIEVSKVEKEIQLCLDADFSDFIAYAEDFKKNYTVFNEKKQESLLLDREIQTLESQILNYSELGLNCPTCYQDVTLDHKESVLALIKSDIKTKKERGITLKESVTSLLKVIQDFEEVEKEINKEKSENATKLNKLLKDKNTLLKKGQELVQVANSLATKVTTLKNQLVLLETNKEISPFDSLLKGEQLKIENRLADIKNKLGEVIKGSNTTPFDLLLREEQLKEESKLNSLKSQVKELVSSQKATPFDSLLQAESVKQEEVEKTVKTCFEKKKDRDSHMNSLAFLEKAFSKQGIPNLLLDQIIPALNYYAAYYSNLLTGGSIEIEFSNQTLLKSKEVREKFEVKVLNKEGALNYDGNSSGEKRRIDLCVLLALQKTAISMKKSRFNLLFLDEIFDTLDSTGMELVIRILKEELRSFPTIFVITHNPELNVFFDNRITVEKKGNFSNIC